MARPLARSVCPVASNPVGDVVHAGFELLQLLRLKARAHYAQAIADTGTDLTVKSSIRHRTDRLRQALRDLIRIREALATPGRPGVRVIAKRFGVDPGTVQRISRPFGGVGIVAAQPLGAQNEAYDPLRVFVAIEAADAGLTGFRTDRAG